MCLSWHDVAPMDPMEIDTNHRFHDDHVDEADPHHCAENSTNKVESGHSSSLLADSDSCAGAVCLRGVDENKGPSVATTFEYVSLARNQLMSSP